VLGHVPAKERCHCREDQPAKSTSGIGKVLRGLFGG
jgi:hypothetical protein